MPAGRRRAKRGPSATVIILVFFVGVAVGYGIFFLSPGKIVEKIVRISANNTQINYSEATANIVAVTTDSSGAITGGVIGTTTVEVRPGENRVLVDTNPFVETDTQQSAETAINVAEEYTGLSPSNADFVVIFNMSAYNSSTTAQVVGGPSAGAAMTVAAIAALEGKQVRKDVAMTGTINEDGSIGAVGGVLEKAQAAAQVGVKTFLVPKGEARTTYYERQVTIQTIRGFVIQRVSYVPKMLDLNNYTQQWGMNVYEVSKISDVVPYAITGAASA